MQGLDYWMRPLREAEQGLAAAARRGPVNAAANKLMRAKTELQLLGRQEPIGSGVAAPAASSC